MHPRTTGLFCAVAAIAIVFGLGTSASAGPVSSQTFAPVADAFVSSLKPTTNFGSGPRLKMDKSPVLTTYIRFDPGVLSDPVTQATLQLYSRTSSSIGFDVRAVADNSWQESSITYANAPAASSSSSGSSGPTRSGRWTTVDVTSLVSGNGPVTIAVTTSSMPELDVDSRQSTKSPKLTVQTSSGDFSAPTVPGNLALTSAAASSLSASWSASTDDTGVVGYDLYLNGSAAGSTAGTSYNFGSLSCGTKYTIGVAAYDAAGNHSTRASLDATTSACPDTQPPSAPTNLAASGATQTSLNLSWSASADNLGVAGYHVFASNTSVGSTGATSYTFNNLTCGTIYTLGVEAYDAAGNVSARSTLTAGTTACSASTTPPPYRFLYNSDSAPATVASYGWNLIDVGSQWSADQLQAGSRGLVWVGDYDNTTCSWEESDAALNSQVTAARGDAKVFGYFISDEPNPYACPNAPAQHKARSDLIHSIDPTKPTVIVLDSNGFTGRNTQDALDQMPLWKGTADYIGLDPYPCYQSSPCDYSWIDKTIQAANAAGLNYWGVIQAFNDSSWRWPTADELSHMINQWGASKQTGYMTFAWTWSGNNLSSQPTLLSALQAFNSGTSSSADTTPPTAPTALTKTAATATSVSLSWTGSTDDVAVTGYNVYRGGNLAGSTTSTSYTVGSLACGTSYSFAVEAKDAAGNVSTRATLSASTSACATSDTTAPTTPSGLKTTGATPSSVSISWTGSTDNVGVAGYGIYLDGALKTSGTQTSYTLSNLNCGTSYNVAVDAYDAAGNRSSQATLATATSACPDTLAPTAPVVPAVTGATETSLSVWWGASLDNVGVAGYGLYLNGAKIGTTAGINYTFSGLSCGTGYTLGVDAFDAAGNVSPRSSVVGSTSACTGADPVIAAAGDICWTDSTTCAGTATLLDQINPSAVLTLGDNQYDSGTLSDYNAYYKPNWGRHDFQVRPAPGNHEFNTANAQGYRDYFGARAPGFYYSYDLGSWHLISLAGDIGISASAGSAQETWLKADLAAHPNQCTLAYWHEPRFSSGIEHGSDSGVSAFWNDLYAAGADIVLNGHEHNYERFAPQSPSGTATATGIREFVVGTGGVLGGYTFGTPIANSEIRNSTTEGVIKLTLHANGYDWKFMPVAGSTFTDAGSGTC